MKKQTVSMIAALGSGRVIGYKNDLLWPIPDDLKRFRELTTGHSIIMGYNTYLSIGKPLPNRHNIVMMRETDIEIEGADIAHSLEEALDLAQGDEVFIIGGAQIYKLAISRADKLYLTLIDDEKEGDAFFPNYSEFTKKTLIEERDFNGIPYSWINFER